MGQIEQNRLAAYASSVMEQAADVQLSIYVTISAFAARRPDNSREVIPRLLDGCG